MEALTTSATKLFTGISSSSSSSSGIGDFSSSGTQIRFFRFPKLSLFYSISSSSFSSTTNTKVHVANAGALIETRYQSKKVHVKFQLHKECLFGEHFFLLGDDPILGLWDPASAIPLQWSEQHIWTVELDIPIGKPIHFKFILKGATEEIFWQPGPDRILQTWETLNTIVVSEDWENVETKKITEEPSIDTDPIDGVNTLYPKEEPMHSNDKCDSIKEDITSLAKEPTVNVSNAAVVDENKTEKELKPSPKQNEGSLVAENMLGKKTKGTQDDDLVGYVGEPVLVPGLTQLPKVITEEVLPIKPESKIAFEASFVTEDPGLAESCEKQEPRMQKVDSIQNQDEITLAIVQEKITLAIVDDEQNDSKEENNEEFKRKNQLNVGCDGAKYETPLHGVVQDDFQWGRKTLQKLLTVLGFSLDQS